MTKIKRILDPYARTTTELSMEESRQLASHTSPEQDKDTVPEIPVRQLLLQHERMIAMKKARLNGPAASGEATPTGPGVYIKVGKGKGVWVEGDNADETPIALTRKIFG